MLLNDFLVEKLRVKINYTMFTHVSIFFFIGGDFDLVIKQF